MADNLTFDEVYTTFHRANVFFDLTYFAGFSQKPLEATIGIQSAGFHGTQRFSLPQPALRWLMENLEKNYSSRLVAGA